jgi:hypothetical protein
MTKILNNGYLSDSESPECSLPEVPCYLLPPYLLQQLENRFATDFPTIPYPQPTILKK